MKRGEEQIGKKRGGWNSMAEKIPREEGTVLRNIEKRQEKRRE